MLKFATGALILLSWFGGPVHGEISPGFKNCLEFFYENIIPEGITGEGICQVYKNKYRFSTLYDKTRRIPFYSAYILNATTGSRPDTPWKIEPQLASLTAGKEMKNQKKNQKTDQNVRESQAVDEDYKNSGYTRGHLAPSSHQNTEDDRRATFTLTNIVPQMKGSNSGPWSNLEQEMLKRFENCTSKMYVITGAMPYKSEEHKIKDRVHIPEYMWTAYCCESFDPKADQNRFPTYAAVGRNDQNSPEDIVKKDPNNKGYDVKEMSLESLEQILKERLKLPGISLFKNKCKK
ncbi:endonuclease domain-containing 1 protein-like [Archocentrus centrarchus]|uniref:endonuclease domain-containing 1 protein-like n=1 Tax=Archocentrus centrarchus TaxID=63155 RepID=UPI0011EA1ECC|nr:endonuclease domain-containing 1 protein-like [Archocentrus centrarchus]